MMVPARTEPMMTAESNRQLAIVRLSMSCIVLRIGEVSVGVAGEFVYGQ